MSADGAFTQALASAIADSGVSQQDLGRAVGRSGAAVNQWLRKGDIPNLGVVFKIEDALGLPVGALVRHHSPGVWSILEEMFSCCRKCRKNDHPHCEAPIMVINGQIERCCCGR